MRGQVVYGDGNIEAVSSACGEGGGDQADEE
jgi:hypothetical protein